jgi:hypothetical protein
MPNQKRHDPYVPTQLELVFDSVWKVIKREHLEPSEEVQLRLALARRLVVLSTSGVTDSAELRRQAIEYFFLEQSLDKR